MVAQALRTAASQLPVRLPYDLPEELQRFLFSLLSVIRGMQERERLREVVIKYGSSTSTVAEADAVPYVERRMELVAAHWSQENAVTASPSSYWTFTLRTGAVGGSTSTRTIARFDTRTDGLVANKAQEFARKEPVIEPGSRLTFEIAETGTAGTAGPGVLRLLLRELD